MIIINANAYGGKAVSVYKSIEGRISDSFGDLTVAVCQKPEDLDRHLDTAAGGGLDLVIGEAARPGGRFRLSPRGHGDRLGPGIGDSLRPCGCLGLASPSPAGSLRPGQG